MWELSTETNRIETAVVRYGVASILATVILRAEDLREYLDECLHNTHVFDFLITDGLI